jgi:hypothetical protein
MQTNDNIQHLYHLLRILDPQSRNYPQPPPQSQLPPPPQPQPQSQSQPSNHYHPVTQPVSFSNIFTNLISTGIRTYLGQQEPPQWVYRTMEFISYIQDDNDDNDDNDNEKNPIKYEGRVKIFENEPGDEKDCSICFDQYCINDEIALTKCNHYFHVTCIEKWLGHSYTCPVCRATEI